MYICSIIKNNNMTKLTKRFDNLLSQLTQDILDNDYLKDAQENDILLEFKNHPGSELGIENNERDNFGIYLSFSPEDNDKPEQYLEAFIANFHGFIPHLVAITKDLFSENFNSESCSYNIKIDTQHLNTTSPINEIYYSIEVSVDDYLS